MRTLSISPDVNMLHTKNEDDDDSKASSSIITELRTQLRLSLASTMVRCIFSLFPESRQNEILYNMKCVFTVWQAMPSLRRLKEYMSQVFTQLFCFYLLRSHPFPF